MQTRDQSLLFRLASRVICLCLCLIEWSTWGCRPLTGPIDNRYWTRVPVESLRVIYSCTTGRCDNDCWQTVINQNKNWRLFHWTNIGTGGGQELETPLIKTPFIDKGFVYSLWTPLNIHSSIQMPNRVNWSLSLHLRSSGKHPTMVFFYCIHYFVYWSYVVHCGHWKWTPSSGTHSLVVINRTS